MNLVRYAWAIETPRQILLIVMVAASVLLGFAALALEGRIIDDAIKVGVQNGSTAPLFRYAAVYLAVVLTALVLSYQVDILYAGITQQILIRLRTDLFDRVLRLGPGFYHRNSVGEIMSRIIPEVQQLGNFLSRLLVVPVSCTLTILAGFGLVTRMDWRLGLASAAIFSTVFLFLPRLRDRLAILSREAPRMLRNISRRTEETLSHIGEIHAHNTYAFEESRFRAGLDEFARINVDTARVFGLTSFLTQSLSQMATLTAYTLGGWLAIREAGLAGGLTVGSIFVVVRALSTVMSPITTVIDYSQRFRESSIRFEMITDYLRIEPDMKDPEPPRSLAGPVGDLGLHGVGFGFQAPDRILRDLSVEIPAGQHVALVGPAGCGKSTILLLLGRMVRATEGEVRVQGQDILGWSLDSLRARIGYLAQAKTSAPLLFSGTLLDNLLYGLQHGSGNDAGKPSDWVDLESVGLKSLDELYSNVVQVLRDVGFYEDVLGFGLTKVTLHDALANPGIFPIHNPDDIRRELLKGRQRFLEKVRTHGPDLVGFFEADHFQEYCGLLENLIFTSPEPYFQDPRLFAELEPPLRAALQEAGLYDEIARIGCRMAVEIGSLLADLPGGRASLASRMGLSSGALWDGLPAFAERIRNLPDPASSLDPESFNRVLRLGLEYNLPRAVDVYIDEDFKKRVVQARRLFRQALPEKLVFYDRDQYVDGATARDNMIMGKVNSTLHRAEDKIGKILEEVIREIDLEDEMIRLGLMMDVGERGGRLSGGQAQKAALARVLLKKPDVLILDEATSALDNASQRRIDALIAEQFKGRTVLHVAHRLDSIRDYDRILVLRAGELVEAGSCQELLDKKGVFYDLWTSTQGEQG